MATLCTRESILDAGRSLTPRYPAATSSARHLGAHCMKQEQESTIVHQIWTYVMYIHTYTCTCTHSWAYVSGRGLYTWWLKYRTKGVRTMGVTASGDKCIRSPLWNVYVNISCNIYIYIFLKSDVIPMSNKSKEKFLYFFSS